MGILSIMNRNPLSKFKSTLKPLSSSYSLDPCYIRRFLSASTAQPNRKLVFLIERFEEKSPKYMSIEDICPDSSTGPTTWSSPPKYSLLFSAADAADKSSWKDRHHLIPNPFFGCTTTNTEQQLRGSCNELTLFFECGSTQQRGVSMWNPTTNRIHTLPLSHLPRPYPVSFIDIVNSGFGFVPKSQDYKFISFLEYYYESGFDSNGECHIELYSLKTDSWKPIDESPHGCIDIQESAVHINGVYYWGVTGEIISFDFADEEFSIIRLPEAVNQLPAETINQLPEFFTGYHLVEFHGWLAILLHTNLVDQGDEPFSFEVLVWDGKTWNCGLPRITIGDDLLDGDKVDTVLGLFQNDFLLLQSSKGELMLFDIKTSKLENLGIHAALKSEGWRGEPTLSVFPFFVPI